MESTLPLGKADMKVEKGAVGVSLRKKVEVEIKVGKVEVDWKKLKD